MPNQNKVIVVRHTSEISIFTVKITTVADSLEESSSDGLCQSSDFFDVPSPEIGMCSESISEEESVPQTSSQGKGKAKAKRAKTTDADASTGKRVAKRTPRTKTQRANSSLNDEEMDDLTSRIFSPEEATRVQEHLRETLLNDARIKDERKRFAEHLLCDAEKQNFQLLLTGFCRKFSTLAAKSFKNNIPSYRKAGFSMFLMGSRRLSLLLGDSRYIEKTSEKLFECTRKNDE